MNVLEQRQVLEAYLEGSGIILPATARLSHIGRRFSAHFPAIAAAVNPDGKPWRSSLVSALADYVSPLSVGAVEPRKSQLHHPKKKKAGEGNRTAQFLRSWEYRNLRMDTLKRYGFKCQCCGARTGDMDASGMPTRIEVDHIKPVSKFWHLRLDPNNLQVLCRECNKGKGNRYIMDFRKPNQPSRGLQ